MWGTSGPVLRVAVSDDCSSGSSFSRGALGAFAGDSSSAFGAALWSTYTCLLAYWVGSSIDNYPLASVYISGLITTVVIAVIFLVIRRRDRRFIPNG